MDNTELTKGLLGCVATKDSKVTADMDMVKLSAYVQQEIAKAKVNELKFAKQAASDNMTFSGWEDDVDRRITELSQTLKDQSKGGE